MIYTEFIKSISENFFIYFNEIDYNANNIHVECKYCGKHIITSNKNFYCDVCNPKLHGTSIQEIAVANYIQDELGLQINRNVRGLINSKFEIDIFIPELKIGIEYNGLYRHSECSGHMTSEYHANKYNECVKRGIQLYQIFSHEWLNNQLAVKHHLKYIFKLLQQITLFDYNIKKIDSNTRAEFLTKYNIKGDITSQIALGLFIKDELVSVATFNTPRVMYNKNKVHDEYEMTRYCSKYNIDNDIKILIDFFIQNYNPNKIFAYSDLRWNTNEYLTAGFKSIGNTSPNYWYTNDYKTLKHRFNFTKSNIVNKMGGNPTLTEWENMKNFGYDRVWDCGNAKFEWIK